MPQRESDREAAIRRLRGKRDVANHTLVFIAVNCGLVIVWAANGGGFFWPVWPLLGWGGGLAMHTYGVYAGRRPLSEGEIRAEIRRQAQRRSGGD